MAESIRVELSFSRPEQHFVELSWSAELAAGTHTLVLPVWTPGSYKVRDFSRRVQGFKVTGADGQAIASQKTRKNHWQFELQEAGRVTVDYALYGFEFTVRTNHIDDRHAFLDGCNTYFYIEGQKDRGFDLVVNLPEGWEAACALPKGPEVGEGQVSYHAKDFEELADSPMFVGVCERLRFEAGGQGHEIIAYNQGYRDAPQWIEDFQKIIGTEIELFGDLPLDRDYIFIVFLFDARGGGLEHKHSTVIQFNKNQLRKAKDYTRFLSLIAHEYFHLWNGKRIRPPAFEPFDFDREIYTRSLWVVEGITAYYDELILRKAGLITDKTYLELIAKHINNLAKNPGQYHDSLADASFDAWIKLYQPDEHSVNCSTSYYEKGQLVAMLFDIELRRRSQGKVSLDTLMKQLWHEYKDSGEQSYQEGHIERIACEHVGEDLQDFFKRFVHGTEALPWNDIFAAVGLKLEPKDKPKPDLGAFLKAGGTRVILERVLEGGPACQAGLSARDELVAINHRRVLRDSFEDRLKDYKPGEVVELTFFRDGDQRSCQVTLGGHADVKFAKREDASDEQKARYQAWLGTEH